MTRIGPLVCLLWVSVLLAQDSRSADPRPLPAGLKSAVAQWQARKHTQTILVVYRDEQGRYWQYQNRQPIKDEAELRQLRFVNYECAIFGWDGKLAFDPYKFIDVGFNRGKEPEAVVKEFTREIKAVSGVTDVECLGAGTEANLTFRVRFGEKRPGDPDLKKALLGLEKNGFINAVMLAGQPIGGKLENQVLAIRWFPGGFVPGFYSFTLASDGAWAFERDAKPKNGKLDAKNKDLWVKEVSTALASAKPQDLLKGAVEATDFPCMAITVRTGGQEKTVRVVLNSATAQGLDKRILDLVKP